MNKQAYAVALVWQNPQTQNMQQMLQLLYAVSREEALGKAVEIGKNGNYKDCVLSNGGSVVNITKWIEQQTGDSNDTQKTSTHARDV